MEGTKSPQPVQGFPRTKTGKMIFMVKDGAKGEKPDQLLTNSYLGKYVIKKPDYWDKLLEMLYGEGRLRKYAATVEDIVDKFSFLVLAKDQINQHEAQLTPQKLFFVKYFTYTFVFMTKSFLDALAVFLNESYGLGFSGGEVDFKKAKFVGSIKDKNNALGTAISIKQSWISDVVKYRDNLIHRHGLYIGPIPTVPEEITDPREVDLFILKEPHYMPNNPGFVTDDICEGKEVEFIRVTCLVDDWINQAFQLFDVVLGGFTVSFEVARIQVTST